MIKIKREMAELAHISVMPLKWSWYQAKAVYVMDDESEQIQKLQIIRNGQSQP